MNIHADDPMGAAAHKAAMFITRMDFRLLTAASAQASPEDRAVALVQFFNVWPMLALAVAELEEFIEGSQA